MVKADNRVQCFCNQCSQRTWHRIIATHTTEGEDANINWSTDYNIIECQGCEQTTYMTRDWCSEWYDEDGMASQDVFFPPRVSREKPEWFDLIPAEIRSVLDELYVALHAGSRYLATVGARTVLDMAIKDRIGDVGTFSDKIKKLEADGQVTKAEADLIDAAVEAGHASAHRGFKPDAKSLVNLIDILESILDKFYASDERQRKLAAQAEALKKKVPPRTK